MCLNSTDKEKFGTPKTLYLTRFRHFCSKVTQFERSKKGGIKYLQIFKKDSRGSMSNYCCIDNISVKIYVIKNLAYNCYVLGHLPIDKDLAAIVIMN